MVETQLSQRAQKILNHPLLLGEGDFALAKSGEGLVKAIRQQSLAQELGCSRRSIGRALKELKEAGLLLDLQKRHKNRCKIYEIRKPNPHPILVNQNLPLPKGEGLSHHAQVQWERYEKTFRIVFQVPDLEKQYACVGWDLRHVTEEMELWRKTWVALRVIYGHPPLI